MKKRVGLLVVMVIVVALLTGCKSSDYKTAVELYENEQYYEAMTTFLALGDYKESADYAAKCNYQVVKDALNDNVWFFESESGEGLCTIRFEGENSLFQIVSFDKDGRHVLDEGERPFTVDEQYIYAIGQNGGELRIAYTLSENAISFENTYYSVEQIKEGLQGCWKYTDVSSLDFGSLVIEGVSEENVQIGRKDFKDSFVYERAATSNITQGINFFGPYDLEYTIVKNGIVHLTGSTAGDTLMAQSNWHFSITDGKIVLLRDECVFEKTDRFPLKAEYTKDGLMAKLNQ